MTFEDCLISVLPTLCMRAHTHTNIITLSNNVRNVSQPTLGRNTVHLSHETRVITLLNQASFLIREEGKGGRRGKRQSPVGS